jgi:hypothetical protein
MLFVTNMVLEGNHPVKLFNYITFMRQYFAIIMGLHTLQRSPQAPLGVD